MRVPLVPGQHAQQDGSQNIRLAWGVRTVIPQWAILNPLLPQAVGLQKLKEVRDWCECRHRRLRIPADENLAAKGFYRRALFNEIAIPVALFRFTLRVSRNTDLIVVHPSR